MTAAKSEPMFEDIHPVNDRLPLLLCALAILIVSGGAIAWWWCHPLLMICDQGLYMHMAKLLLEGKVPYVDMFEINPPLAIYLHVIPVLASRFFNITIPLAFDMFIWAMIISASLVSIIAAWRSGSRGSLYICMVSVFALVCFSQSQLLDFGQRDHIFAILYFPFFIVRYLRWQGLKIDRSLAVIAGIMGGIGISLKHYFVPVALAAEIVWLLDKRALRPLFRTETLAAAATMLVYALHFLFLPRAELQTFFSFIVPIYQAGYSYYMTSLSYNFFWSRPEMYTMIATTIGAFVLASRSSFLLPLQAFSLTACAIFVLAGQVWTCHTMEIRMASQMAIFVQLLLLSQYLPATLLRKSIVPVLAGLGMVAFAVLQVCQPLVDALRAYEDGEVFFVYSLKHAVISPKDDIEPYTRVVLQNTDPSDSILFISSAMAPGYPIYQQTDRMPASRMLHGMVLPMLGSIIDEAAPQQKAKYEASLKQVLEWYTEDISRNQPRLIFVQSRFVYDMLLARGFIKSELSNYRLIQEKDDYRVYLRVD